MSFERLRRPATVEYGTQYIKVKLPATCVHCTGLLLHVSRDGAMVAIYPEVPCDDAGAAEFLVDDDVTGVPGIYYLQVKYGEITITATEVEVTLRCVPASVSGRMGASLPCDTPTPACPIPQPSPPNPNESGIFGGTCK